MCCWDCFQQYLDQCHRVDAVETYVDKDGCITCPTPNCRLAYDIAEIAAATPDPAIAMAVIDLKRKHIISDRSIDEQVHQLQHDAEQEPIEDEQRQLNMMIREVQDSILTLRCPNQDCRRPFADFEGCCAVTCSGAGGCNQYFCAFCFHVSKEDVHPHVAACHKNPKKGEMFAPVEEVRLIWQERKKIQVLEYFDKIPAAKRSILAKCLKKDMQDNSVVLNDSEICGETR